MRPNPSACRQHRLPAEIVPRGGLCGPGSARFPGPLALMAPCGGWSGLPKEAARAAFAVMTAPAAETASISRLENMVVAPLRNRCGYEKVRPAIEPLNYERPKSKGRHLAFGKSTKCPRSDHSGMTSGLSLGNFAMV